MNERFFLKLLLALFSGLIVAELLVVAFYGLRLELILLCFIIAVALTGIVIVARLLVPERSGSESVSMRRARAMREESLRDRFGEYAVDEEFLDGKGARRSKVSVAEPSMPKSSGGSSDLNRGGAVSLENSIRAHAEMYGGLRQLLMMMEKIDETAFSQLKAKAGLGGVSKSEVICQIRAMAAVEEGECCETFKSSLDETIKAFSCDRESFEDYIRRSMTTGGDQSSGGDEGFSVELDSAALSQVPGTMPEDFSHDPKAVFSKLKKSGLNS